jgi:succinate dehydrogenase / fumarate reductase cytochrome b subunit
MCRKPLEWGELDPYRRQNASIGRWAWIGQRVSALAIVILLVLHLILTYKMFLQFLLLLTVSFHAALGLRVMLLDFKLVSVRYQRVLAWSLMGLAVAITLAVWFAIYR